MKDLIEALQIFAKYQEDTRWPTCCEHDVMYIIGVGKETPSVEDQARLTELGFLWMDDEGWGSFRFGSA